MKRVILILITLIVSIALVVAIMYAIVINRDNYTTDTFDRLIPQLMERYKVPGVAVSLVQGDAVWSKGYGLADQAQGIPVTDDTVFQVASISKAVTSWGVMKLVEKGQLDLDAPVEQYLTRWHLPPSSFDASGVTIRRLLSHSAGLSTNNYYGLPPDQALPSLEESLSRISGGVQIVMEPGTQYNYAGGGFTLLQLIIEEVTGETFAAYMQREVLDPLGMSHSSFEWRKDLRPATAVGYTQSGSPYPNFLFTEQAAAGLHSTAEDLARFVAAEMPGPNGEFPGRGVLAPETLDLMFEPLFPLQMGAAQGLGQSILTIPDGSKVIQHWGGSRGWRGYIAANPKWGMGFVILTNSDNGESLNQDTMMKLFITLFIGKILWIMIPVLILALLICAFFLNKSLASHRQLMQQSQV
jgi:CubicO group peptidase (beta-lactamase class C family)